MASTDTLYSARFLLPEYLERGRANLIQCPVYRDGALVAPSSGTVSVFKPDQTAIVNAQSVSVTGSVAQYSVTAGTLPASLELEEGYLVEWSLAMPDGVTHIFRNEGALARRRLYPVISDIDLIRRHSDLSALRPSTLSSYQDYLDEAWASLEARLIGEGQRIYLIMSPSALRDVHLFKTLELIFVDFHQSTGAGKYMELASHYGKEYGRSWSRLNFIYDRDQDGAVDDPYRRRGAAASIWLNGRDY